MSVSVGVEETTVDYGAALARAEIAAHIASASHRRGKEAGSLSFKEWLMQARLFGSAYSQENGVRVVECEGEVLSVWRGGPLDDDTIRVSNARDEKRLVVVAPQGLSAVQSETYIEMRYGGSPSEAAFLVALTIDIES